MGLWDYTGEISYSVIYIYNYIYIWDISNKQCFWVCRKCGFTLLLPFWAGKSWYIPPILWFFHDFPLIFRCFYPKWSEDPLPFFILFRRPVWVQTSPGWLLRPLAPKRPGRGRVLQLPHIQLMSHCAISCVLGVTYYYNLNIYIYRVIYI